MVSGTISLPYSGYFSPFPHGTSSLSVSQEYLALPDGAGRFGQRFTSADLLRILTDITRLLLQGYHLLWLVFPEQFEFSCYTVVSVLQPRSSRNCCGLGYSVFARHYLRNHYCFLFLQLLRCFSSLGLLLCLEILQLHWSGLPHSEICGSIRITDPRSLSQLVTSFFASESLGIPHTLLFASCSTKFSVHAQARGLNISLSF